MPEIDEHRLALLRHRFWRYLNWQQRSVALYAAGMIPKDAPSPLPQTIEMAAINASSPAKIRALWTEVMKLVPEGARTECP